MKTLLEHTVEVRWADMDALNHINNTLYFRYMEEARIHWLQRIGYAFSAATTGPVIVSTACEFKRPVVFPAKMTVRLSANPPGRSSLKTYYHFESDDAEVAVGEAVIVWVDYQRGQSIAIPSLIRDALSS